MSSVGQLTPSTVIKSVQSGSILISNGSPGGGYADTATISAVNTSKSVVLFGGFNTAFGAYNADSYASMISAVELTSSTVVTARRYAPGGTNMVTKAFFTVIEYW